MRERKKVDKIKKTAGESELDVRLKEFWRRNDHFADLINAVVFHGRQRITPDMLIEQDTDISGVVSFPEYEETLRRNHDVVKKLALDTEFQVWSVENQKKAHFAMPLRTMIYDAWGYLKEYKNWRRSGIRTGRQADCEESLRKSSCPGSAKETSCIRSCR